MRSTADDVWTRGRGQQIGFRYLYLCAARARELAKTDRSLRGSVEYISPTTKEVGGDIGPRWLLEKQLTKPDYAIGAGFRTPSPRAQWMLTS